MEAQALEEGTVSKRTGDRMVGEERGCILLLTGADFSIVSTKG